MTPRPRIPVWWVLAALVRFVAASTMRAQRPADVQGIVVDSVSRQPIARARIDLFEQPRSGPRISRAQTMTDSSGRFRIGSVALASALASSLLEVRQIGFAPRVVILDDSRLRDTLIIVLAPTAISLGEVRIVEKAGRTQRRLEVSGFVDRRKAGIGKFLDSARVARSNATTLVSLLHPISRAAP